MWYEEIIMFQKLFRRLVWLLVLLILVSCHRDKELLRERFSIKQELNFDSTQRVLIIENPHSYQVAFHLKVSNLFPLDSEDIKQIVELRAKENKVPIEQAAWQFVNQLTFNNLPYTTERWQHNPQLFINSIGGGYCDDRATTLVAIWKNWFDSARVVNLGGHVVAEVKSNGKWQMFDSDKGVAYLDEDKEVCSIDELEDSAKWISNPKEGYVLGNNVALKCPTPRAKELASLYASDSNNVDVTKWHLRHKELSSLFILPSNSRIELIMDFPYKLVIHLSPESKGELQIPFVPYKASGNIDFIENGNLQSVNSNNYLFSNNEFHNNLQIVKAGQKSKIEYLINPKLDEFVTSNRLYINSTDSLKLFTERLSEPIQHVLFGEVGLYFDIILKNYSSELEEWSKLEIDNLVYNDFEDMFLSFLEEDSDITSEQIKKNVMVFRNVYLSFCDDEKKMKKYKRAYPVSMLLLFASIKDNKLDYFKSLTNKHD